MHDRETSWRWAYVRRSTVARESPDRRSPAVARVAATTLVGSPEVVLALEGYTGRHGVAWIRARLPVRPNGSIGWLPASSLGELRTVRRRLVVDTVGLRARLVRGGDTLWEAPVAVGGPNRPTPRGEFFVRLRMVPPRASPFYGAFAFWTSGFVPPAWWPRAGWIGVHGTNRPELVPGRVSAGCVRMRDEDVLRLRELLPVGAPVSIV
jgi:hypothetical protein